MAIGSRSRLTVMNEREVPLPPDELEEPNQFPTPANSPMFLTEQEMRKILTEALALQAERQESLLNFLFVAMGASVDKVLKYALPLIATGGGLWLWASSLGAPSQTQLIGLGLYGVLVEIPILWMTLKR